MTTRWIEIELKNNNNIVMDFVVKLICLINPKAKIDFYTKNIEWRFVGESKWKPL